MRRYLKGSMNILTTPFEKENFPVAILPQGLINIRQSTETAPNNDVIKLSVLWEQQLLDNPTYHAVNLTDNKSPSIIIDKAILAHGRCGREQLRSRNWISALVGRPA
jgi:hypothetical protein